ncbi:MAG TPA: hypothetical protein PK359_03720, partial [Burkholderiaceae bacterium]|nr:hypothetical protein [Burkholderiaceae bacterium]
MTFPRPGAARSLVLAAVLAAGLMGGGASAASTVCLLRADHSRAFIAAQGGDQDRLLAPMRAALSRLDHGGCELAADGLATEPRPAVLVVASAVSLSARERASIAAFVARGGSVLGTWASGSRDETGQWLGYGWLRQVFGVEVTGDISPDADQRHLLPFGESPLNTSVGAGRRLFLNRSVEPLLRARLREAGAVNGASAAGDSSVPLATAAAR